MQTTDKRRPFGIPLYVFVLILVLALAFVGAIAGYYLDLSMPSIFSGNQSNAATSIQTDSVSNPTFAQQVPFQSDILVENRAWSRHAAQQVPFQTGVLVENRAWSRQPSARQVPFQTSHLVENRDWSR